MQGTCSENFLFLSFIPHITKDSIRMDLHAIISYWTEIPFAQVVQTLSTKPPTFVLIPQKSRWVESDFFILFSLLRTPFILITRKSLISLILSGHVKLLWKNIFLFFFFLKDKTEERKKTPCKVLMFKSRIILDKKPKYFTT